MRSLRTRLPPLSSLVAFEAAARRSSFTIAAGELGVTQAAISRQIRALEEHLGVMLFRRMHRTVRLTAEGQRLHSAVKMGLEHIADTATGIRRAAAGAHVTVSAAIAFATFWLMPRIAKFRAAFPEIELRLVASDHLIDPVEDGVDAAIRYGGGNWPGLRATHLFDEEIFPVCSPAYLERRPAPISPGDLIKETLLRMNPPDQSWIDWDTWLKEFGVMAPAAQRGPEFNTYTILIQAAVGGQGVALGWRHMVEDLLAAGSLVRPIATSLSAQGAYYLVVREDIPLHREAAAFCDWLIAEATDGAGMDAGP